MKIIPYLTSNNKISRNLIKLVPDKLKQILNKNRELDEWKDRLYCAPSPSFIKRIVLLRHSLENCIWIETGTALGETTKLLAQDAYHVHSIEPSESLFCAARDNLSDLHNITLYNNTSELILLSILQGVKHDNVCFWLDGHYSGGITFKGSVDTPILLELRIIEENLERFKSVVVLIDDIRCFDPSNPLFRDYPSIDYLVDWARKNKFQWSIEHDIFIAILKK
jgi:hypothetical protein